MEISARKVASDAYSLNFDGTEVILSGAEIKELLLQITGILLPHGSDQGTREMTLSFIRHIKGANDVGIQKFMRVANEDDILILLKVGEDDDDLLNKFYDNMTKLSRKVFTEDINYRFKEAISQTRVRRAVERLIRTADELEDEGSLTFANITARKVAKSLAKG